MVDDTDPGIKVYAPELGDWVDVSVLSQGTLDLVYLAARIGLVRLVTGDRRPPLVLDDPFVTLDDDRAKRALALLKEISADFQVIYLTTSNRYDKTADKVSQLPGPTAVTPDIDPAAEIEAALAGHENGHENGTEPAAEPEPVGEPEPAGEPVAEPVREPVAAATAEVPAAEAPGPEPGPDEPHPEAAPA
jgi:hypothetical protein